MIKSTKTNLQKNRYSIQESKLDENDNSRITISVGLITLYVAAVNFYNTQNLQNYSIINTTKNILAILWGLPTFLLVLFLFLQILSYKYVSPDTVSILGYDIKIYPKLKRVMFDVGVESYISGVALYALNYLPYYLIERGLDKTYALIIFIILFLVASFILLLIEKKQKSDNFLKKQSKNENK